MLHEQSAWSGAWSVHVGCFLPGSVRKGNGGMGLGPLQSKWTGPALGRSLWTPRTQLSVSFFQVRMEAKALDGPPRGPCRVGTGEPERALGR